jgi:polyphosphate kinase
VYAFERHGEHKVYIASADLMPRNLDHRVELAVPIEAEELRSELLDVLERCFADNQNSWDLDSNGVWTRRAPAADEEPRSVQQELAELYAARAATDRPSGERDQQAPDGRERAVSATAQPVAAAGSASRARLSSSTDW